MTVPPDFQLRGVSRSYGPEDDSAPRFVALRDVDVQIPAGAFTTIVGPSGSGKSTLLGLLGLLDAPTTGDVCVAGESTAQIGEEARCLLRASRFGFVFQAFHLMTHRSVLDNVMLGGLYRGLSRAQRREEALHCLEQVGLASKAANAAGTLSGGERQRTAIARALVGGPRVLLCDEPTGNLDTTNGAAVAALLTGLFDAGRTSIVLVTHDPELAALGTHRLQVVDGQVSGDGVA